MQFHTETESIVKLAILTALAVVLHFAESFLPSFFPGAKLGLTNLVTVYVLYRYSFQQGCLFLLVRVLLTGFLSIGFGSSGFFIGASGALLSFLVMKLAVQSTWFSPVGVGVAGAVAHNIGQLMMALLFIEAVSLIYYLPVLLLLAVPCGMFTGFCGEKLISYI